MKKILHWLDENLEEFILVIFLIAMTLIMGIQVFCRYVLGMSLSWSEELTRYLFIWCGFLSVSYCSKKCLSIKIEQFVAIFPRRGKAIFKVVNHTFTADSFHRHAAFRCTMYRPHLWFLLYWSHSVSCSAGSLSSVLQEVKMYLTRHIRKAIPQIPLSRQMQNPITNLLWN